MASNILKILCFILLVLCLLLGLVIANNAVANNAANVDQDIQLNKLGGSIDHRPRVLFKNMSTPVKSNIIKFLTKYGRKPRLLEMPIHERTKRIIMIMDNEKLSDVEVLRECARLLKQTAFSTSAISSRPTYRVASITNELEIIRKGIKNPKQAFYLDIGCGNGTITKGISETLNIPASHTFGVDIKKPDTLDIKDTNFSLVKDSRLPYKDNHFDLISMFMSAHHFTDIQKMMAETRRVAKDGCYLLMREHAMLDAVDEPLRAQGLDSETSFLDIIHALYASTEVSSTTEQTPEQFIEDYDRPGGYSHYNNVMWWVALANLHGFELVADPSLTHDMFGSLYLLFQA